MLSILLLEDDCDDSEIITDIIRGISPGCRVNCFVEVDEVFDHLSQLSREEYPALIILDYNLPKVSGMEFLKLFNADKRYKNIPVVMYTTSARDNNRLEALKLGCKMYNIKKNTAELMKKDVKEMLTYCNFPL